MEFPDEWLACDEVPKDLKDMFETRNRNRKERQKKLNSLSDEVSDVKLFRIQQNKVKEHIFIFHANIFLSNILLSSVFFLH